MIDSFIKAVPIWGDGLEKEKNTTLGLYKKIIASEKDALLRVATSGFYRVFVNGKFAYFGPARCTHGYFRVDQIPIELNVGENHIAIQVVNYYVNSFYYICQKGFIQAELISNGEALAATGGREDSFELVQLNERIKKVQRYSYQRPFAEAYNFKKGCNDWIFGEFGDNTKKICAVITEEKELIERKIPLNKFPKVLPASLVSKGEVFLGKKPNFYKKDRSLEFINVPDKGNLQGYYESDLQVHLSDEVQEFPVRNNCTVNAPYCNLTRLKASQFEILSFPVEKTGFITVDIECLSSGTLYFLFDEILSDNGDVDPLRMECCNAVKIIAEKGKYHFMSAEPYGFKYLKGLCADGEFVLKNLSITEAVCPKQLVNLYQSEDADLNQILTAARENFIQNSFDLFTDCPTRERAGWLCDSYFLGMAEYEFTGENVIEKNFLENYLIADNFKNIPQGMVPMCYPSDQESYGFIPNWAMWLILEIEIFAERDMENRKLIEAYKDRIYSIIDWFADFENSDGLLEKLPGWVFVEWSKANDFVQDINFPSNMLYARTLEAVSKMYNDEKLAFKAKTLKVLVERRSFNGEFFTDNNVYVDGEQKNTNNCTETCQYYAFFTGIATPERYPELWNRLTRDFGPDRSKSGAYPQIYPSNAFIGNILRLMLLEKYGYFDMLLQEIKGYYLYMAQTTGTLWEHIDTHASCNHGFASYIACLIRAAEQGLKKDNI